MSPEIVNVEIDEILDKLSTQESMNLIAEVGPWHTASVELTGITVPAIKVRLS
jgi:hypothetical protein